MVVAELTGDDRPEVLYTASYPGTGFFQIVSFSRRMEINSLLYTASPTVFGALAWLRGDADAAPDLFTFNNGVISFQRHLGGLAFAAPIITNIGFSTSLETVFMHDFTGDGFADAAYVDRVPPQVRLYVGDGAGGFQVPVITPLPFYVPGGSESITADVNSDGTRDLIVQGRILLGTTSGAFQVASAQLPASQLDSGDVNGDGRTDVLCRGALGLMWYLQQSGMTFVAGPALPSGPYENYHVLDVDQDGRLDVLRVLTSTVGPIKLAWERSVPPHALPYVWPYGIGTPGCRGHVALSANLDPTVGQQQFAIIAANAPQSAPGLLLAQPGPMVPQFEEPLGLGARFSVWWFNPNNVFLGFQSDHYGQARYQLPIASTGSLGMTIDFQACWLAPNGDGACSASPLGLVSSNALEIHVH